MVKAHFPFMLIWNALLWVPTRCLLCNDFAAETADIAVADAWLPEYEGNQEGYSIVLTHTKQGAIMVQDLIDSKCLELEPRNISEIGCSQYCQLDYKKRTVAARARILGKSKWIEGKSIGRLSIEDYLVEFLNILKNRVVQIVPAFTRQMSSQYSAISHFEKFLMSSLLKLYSKVMPGSRVVLKSHLEFNKDVLENMKGSTYD